MDVAEADRILELSPHDALNRAISTVFRRLLANIVLEPENPKYHVVREENKFIRDALSPLPNSVVEALFAGIGFKRTQNANSETIYVFTGNSENIKEADYFLSQLEDRIEKGQRKEVEMHFVPPETKVNREREERRQQILQEIQRDAEKRQGGTTESESPTPINAFYPGDYTLVENLIEKSRRTLLNTGRVRNFLFEGRHFTLRRMVHGRVYICKEGCGTDFLEAHWHLFTGKNLMYSYVAHLSPDATAMMHLGVEHGYQYNSLPGTKNFRRTVHFSAKRINEANGLLEYIEHPDKPSETCIYCGKPFSELFL
ncbi:hypothetical protein TCDM_09164 [Trypanosoma cruzi Dm28c]|uniref:PUB domain-containing protein n=2 Tax=Trypanosoma cruzi TaxID=5693 RepID=V5D6M9_TRYCR|nr:hypothetical protein TCDM_09164 [Trypanosoma cruzi Dm28c]PBJ70886.1 hypothetical protein BCY84_17836 [Trypanosoma cruzi cruzi]PWV00971.1 hypothetical protein C4B63_5g772 [Trypanosoma cruzi]